MQLWKTIKGFFHKNNVEKITFYAETAAVTNVGLRRSENEDNYYFHGACLPLSHNENSEAASWEFEMDKTQVLAVFDGMGGESAGDLASYTSAKTFEACVRQWRESDQMPSENDVGKMLNDISQTVYEKARENQYRLIGSTATVLFLRRDEALIADLGDSPMYLQRDGELDRISVPHTDEELLRQQGIQRKPGLTQFLGIDTEEMRLEPYVQQMELRDGDQFLLCSDGLTDMVPEVEIHEVLSGKKSVREKVQMLMERTLQYGGRDNVTIILCKINKK